MASDRREERAMHHQNLEQAKRIAKSLERIAAAAEKLNETLNRTNATLETLKPLALEPITLMGDNTPIMTLNEYEKEDGQ